MLQQSSSKFNIFYFQVEKLEFPQLILRLLYSNFKEKNVFMNLLSTGIKDSTSHMMTSVTQGCFVTMISEGMLYVAIII